MTGKGAILGAGIISETPFQTYHAVNISAIKIFCIISEESFSENVYLYTNTPAYIYSLPKNMFDIECILDIIFSVQFGDGISQMQLPYFNGVYSTTMKTFHIFKGNQCNMKLTKKIKKINDLITHRE